MNEREKSPSWWLEKAWVAVEKALTSSNDNATAQRFTNIAEACIRAADTAKRTVKR